MGSGSRSLGILYCTRYGASVEDIDDSFLYIGINMYWEPYTFGLPQMPKDKEWVRLFTTEEQKKEADSGNEEAHPHNILVPPRTIVIYGTRTIQAVNQISRRNKKGKRTE